MISPVDSGGKDKKASLVLSHSILSNKVIFVVCLVVAIALVADVWLARTSDLLSPNLSRESGIMAVFVLISVAYFIGQFMILGFVRYKSKEIHSRANVRFYTTYKATMSVQIALSIILLFVILQLIVVSYYFIMALIVAVTISYSLAIAMMVFLMKSFLSWFRISKNFVIFAYGISAATLTIHLGFTLFFAASVLLDVPAEVKTAISRPPFFMPGSIKFLLDDIRNLTSILSFSVMWGATVLLLHHYSQKIGRIKYWILVTLTLVYFLSQFPTLFLKVFDPIIKEDPFFYTSLLTFIFTLSKPAGGILFGIAFWIISRNVSRTIVKDYLMISALGFFFLFTSDQAIVLTPLPFPPFGLASVSFMGLSANLIFIGIYYSAISLSHDDRVRREIKKFAIQESRLLDSIGSAQLEKDISQKARAIAQVQDSAAERLGVPPSISEGDIKKYVEDVLHEMAINKKIDKS
jgi:hypothetical protein